MDNKKQIASFLEMTTFGPKMSEIEALDNLPSWGTEERAQYVRDQMDMDATSHREYFRKRTNSKWDATAQPARSSHPCSPNSKWRRYSYTRQDRYDTISSQYIVTEYETVAEEADLTYTIHEADSVDDVKSYGSEVNTWSSGLFSSSQVGFSGTGYYDMGRTGDHIEFEVNIAQGDMYPISFRFAMGSSYEGGNRPCKLSVNGNTVVEAYDFVFTDSWRYYMYSNLIDVQLNPGLNTIRVDVGEAGGGPNIDHLRIGKPPAVVMKTNGWPRVIAKNGIHCLDYWPCDFTDGTSTTFIYYPEPPMGDLYRNNIGYLRVNLDGYYRFLDIGNPPIDFTGFEDKLPSDVHVFEFTDSDTFVNTASDLFSYPIHEGQEMLLSDGFAGLICDNVPPFAEEGDAPIFGILPNGEGWIQWTPTILFEDNGPSVNADLQDQDMISNILIDGGGELVLQTNEMTKCSNVLKRRHVLFEH
ncbi:hypothetical protein ACHAXR_002788 [Thalassiosira sp. AJA248-18]